jgi:hypothetical protein
MRIIKTRMQGRGAQDFADFLAANPDLVEDVEPVILGHYSRDRLYSAAARDGWVEPDLQPFEQSG